VTLNLYQGPIGFSLNLNTTGDRYKAHNLNKREVAIDSGVSLRILFLTIKYTSDISKVYEGNQYQISIGKPFTIGDSIRFIPRIVKEYQNTSFTNYYYGVIEEEIGVFKKYSLDNAANDIIGLTTILKLSEAMNFSINYSRKTFDEVIYKSPTIQLRRYNMTSIFWSFLF
jgi:outer membrane scaffolding protein for murein synthesis (MipA/OmpV family)